MLFSSTNNGRKDKIGESNKVTVFSTDRGFHFPRGDI